MNTIIVITILLAKKLIDVNYSALFEETESSYKLPKFKVGIFLAKITPKIEQEKSLLLILC